MTVGIGAATKAELEGTVEYTRFGHWQRTKYKKSCMIISNRDTKLNNILKYKNIK
jgi:hypothetical protein